MPNGTALLIIHIAKCLVIKADVTQEKEVEAAVEQAVAQFGRIDYAAYV